MWYENPRQFNSKHEQAAGILLKQGHFVWLSGKRDISKKNQLFLPYQVKANTLVRTVFVENTFKTQTKKAIISFLVTVMKS